MARTVLMIGIGLVIGFVAVQLLARAKKSPLTVAEINRSLVIDVRSPGEYASGHFKNAVNIPLDQLADQAAQLKLETRPIIVYCRSGNRSGQAVQLLESAGIKAKNGVNQSALESTK